MKKNHDILSGTIWKALLAFFFPILIGTFFQQLYNTVDAAIVGSYAGKVALSSVGGSSAIIINLVVGFFTGLSAGCTVMISQFFGAGDRKRLDIALHTSYAFGILGGIVFGVLGIVLTPWVLTMMKTPEELMANSILYLRIYFSGLVFLFLYNMGAAILRALGDSRRPLYYLIVSTLVNIVLDCIFVLAMNLGVLGVAVATLLSQAVSALLVTLYLMTKLEIVKLELRRIRLDKEMFLRMIRIGLPSGVQSSTYSLSNMFIQSAINLFGVNTIAAWAATGKVDVIFWMINGSFGIAAATFVGQNFGANNMDRVHKGTRTCLFMSLGTAIVISAFLLTGGKYMLWLFADEAVVIEIGQHMLNLIVPGYFMFVFIEIFSSALRAVGDTLFPTVINIASIVVFRVIWIMIFIGKDDLDMILYCYPLSWAICAVFMSTYYFYRRRRPRRRYAV